MSYSYTNLEARRSQQEHTINVRLASMILFSALIIPVIVCGAMLKIYADESWAPGNCTVLSVVHNQDDYPTCRTLYQIRITAQDNSSFIGVACVSVNARQTWGGQGGDSVCGNIDGRPWKDGPLLPAAWKCSLGKKYDTNIFWRPMYASKCLYQCGEQGCVGLIDQDQAYVGWFGYYVFAGVALGLCSVVCVYGLASACFAPQLTRFGFLITSFCVVPLLGWYNYLIMDQPIAAVILIVTSVFWLGTVFASWRKPHVSAIFFGFLLGIELALYSNLFDILFLTGCIHFFIHAAVLTVVKLEESN